MDGVERKEAFSVRHINLKSAARLPVCPAALAGRQRIASRAVGSLQNI
jgi:hypothetical protein